MKSNAAYPARISELHQDGTGGDVQIPETAAIPLYLQYLLHCVMFMLGQSGTARKVCSPKRARDNLEFQMASIDQARTARSIYKLDCHLIRRGLSTPEMVRSVPESRGVLSAGFWHGRDGLSVIETYSTARR